MTAEELVKCPSMGLEGITSKDDAVSLSGDDIIRILKENMRDYPILATA
ncbi:MAG: hypothetical protein ACXQT0_02720 [Candidatus Methanofastidiosia archaeon]